MLEVTLTQVQTYLGLPIGIDDRLEAILDGINVQVFSNVGDLSLGEKTMMVKNTAVKCSTFTLNIMNPTKLNEINGNDVSSLTSGTDYLIKSDGDVIVKDLYQYTSNDFGYFKVKFEAGYSIAPKTLIAIVSEYSGYLYSQDLGKDVVEEQLGPRSVTFDENNVDGQNQALKKFKKGLNQFIPLALRIY